MPITANKAGMARWVVALVLAGPFAVAYFFRPDFAQALHWWPMVLWTPVVLAPFMTLRPKAVVKPFMITLGLWSLCVVIVGEPSWRIILPPGERGRYRVVSLNCEAGNPQAAAEAFEAGGDIVLLQEVSSREDFEAVATSAGYKSVAFGPDTAVFVRGSRPISGSGHEIDQAWATVDLDGQRLKVISLRLQPPVFRLDLWSPDCWRNYSRDLEERRKRLREICANIGETYLFGGDFNATNPRLGGVVDGAREAHRTAGRGWGGTGTNDFPFVRVDRIWASPTIEWTQAFVRKTKNSDHRMVVADFRFARVEPD